MALDNFIPNVWAAGILDNIERNGSLRFIADNQYSRSEIKGNRVKISEIGAVTISDYTKNAKLTYQALDSAGQWLELNQQKSFSVLVDKIALAQSDAGLMSKTTEKASWGLINAADSYIAALSAGAGNTITKTSVKSTLMNSIISAAKSKVIRGGALANQPMFIAVAPEVYERMYLAKLVFDTNNSDVLANGSVGKFQGMDIYVSNSFTDQASSQFFGMVGTYDSIAFADNVNELSAGDHPDYHSNFIKGLYVYGAKVIQAGKLCKLDITLTAETAV